MAFNSSSAFFQQKLQKINDAITIKLAGHVSNPLCYDHLHVGQRLSSFTEVTIDEVRKLLTSMPAKSSLVDFVPKSAIKECPELFAEIIARLATLSFGEGCFPKKFRSAMVRPLLKKEDLDRNAPCNYRPISNLNTLSKVQERLALVRIRQHLITSPNYNRAQSAYRRNHSTESALLRTLDAAYKAMDRGEATLLVALDIPAAFDTVVHSTLVQRLHSSYGVDGNILAWITSYLSER